MIDEFLLDLLGCPRCPERPPLRLEGKWLVCDQCNCAYPIVDEIPQLLPEDAHPLSEVDLTGDGG